MVKREPTVVIVGAGLGGVRTAEELGRAGHTGRIVLVGEETYAPYDRPPLSKEVLRGTRSAAHIRLREDGFFAENNIELRLGMAAESLDVSSRRIVLTDGTVLEYDQLVVATGLQPRAFPARPGEPKAHVLRTLDDCLALRHALRPARSVLVVGGGFVGCEVAASLIGVGLKVCLVEAQATLLGNVLGNTVGAMVARLHEAAGVDLHCGIDVAEIVGEAKCVGAKLADGTEVVADVVLAGIGSEPAIGLLSSAGVAIGDGVLCDERGATSADGVWAVGDVAAWRTRGGVHRRVEHWTRAGEQARIVAQAITGARGFELPIPYFWSDQYGLKIQVFGDVNGTDDASVVHDDGRRFLAIYSAGGVVTAVAGAGMAGKVTKLRSMIGRPAGLVHEVVA